MSEQPIWDRHALNRSIVFLRECQRTHEEWVTWLHNNPVPPRHIHGITDQRKMVRQYQEALDILKELAARTREPSGEWHDTELGGFIK